MPAELTKVRGMGSTPYRATFDDPTVVSTCSYVDPRKGTLSRDFEQRYVQSGVLGEGGMGTVYLCYDRQVGRDVAMKLVAREVASNDATTERFFREARVQGQLEHPGIVPVYEIGKTPDGAPYFTMKRVKGHTLQQVLQGLRDGIAWFSQRYARRRLLSAFSSVCVAIAYAHSRGVVHRDLKPANIMLGDFGEVIVLDWGLAKVPDDAEWSPSEPRSGERAAPLTGRDLDGQVALLGTPGYMPPEQIQRHDLVGTKADVYALGAILFEIVAGEPLHRADDVKEVLASTFADPEPPSLRVPQVHVPAELDELCVAATRSDPSERPTARQLHEAVERLLDGVHDTELFQVQAAERVAMAQLALARSRLEEDPHASADCRACAIREATAATALDPSNQSAVRTLTKLLQGHPHRMPPEATLELDAWQQAELRSRTRALALGHLGWLFLLPLVFLQGFESLWLVGPAVSLGLGLSLLNYASSKKPHISALHSGLLCAADYLGVAAVAVLLGGWIFVPAVALSVLTLHVLHTRPRRHAHGIMLLAAFAATALPLVLQWAGVLPAVGSFEAGGLQLRSWIGALAPTPTSTALVLCNVHVMLVAFGSLVRTARRSFREEEQLALHAWQLRQLVSNRPGSHKLRSLESEHPTTQDAVESLMRIRGASRSYGDRS